MVDVWHLEIRLSLVPWLCALELLAEMDGAELSQYLKKVRLLENDLDGSIRAAAKRVRLKCEADHAAAEAAAAEKAARQQQKQRIREQQQMLRQRQKNQARGQTTSSRPAAASHRPAGAYRVGGYAVPAEAIMPDGTKAFD